MREKSMGGVVIAALVLVMGAPAFSQAGNQSAGAGETFEFYEGASLYAAWQHMNQYREQYGDSAAGFLAFWRDSCKLNPKFSCTDLAYRHIPVGTLFVLPALTPPVVTKVEGSTLYVEPQEPPAKKVEVKTDPLPVKDSLEKVSGGLAKLEQTLQSAGTPKSDQARVIEQSSGAPWWLAIVLGAVSAIQFVWQRRRNPHEVLQRELSELQSKHEREVTHLRLDRLEFETKAKMLEAIVLDRFHVEPTPEGMRRIEGGDFTYFPYASSSTKDEPTVLLKSGAKVKVANLRRALDRLSEEALKQEGFERIPYARPIGSEPMFQGDVLQTA